MFWFPLPGLGILARLDRVPDPAELLVRGGDASLGPLRNRGFRQGALWRQYGRAAYRYPLVEDTGDHHEKKKGA